MLQTDYIVDELRFSIEWTFFTLIKLVIFANKMSDTDDLFISGYSQRALQNCLHSPWTRTVKGMSYDCYTVSSRETHMRSHELILLFLFMFSFQACIWDYYGKSKNQVLNNFDQTLEDAELQMDQEVTILGYGIFGDLFEL